MLSCTATSRDASMTSKSPADTPILHPNIVLACASLLRQYAHPQTCLIVRCLHCYIISHGLEKHKLLERLLVQTYGKCGSAADAFAVFARMLDPDLVSWNFVIGACAKHGETTKASQLFEQMQLEGHLPDHYLFATILSACCFETALHVGKLLHARIAASGLEYDMVVATTLVNMYGKCSNGLKQAQMSFDNIQDKDVVSWNALLTAHLEHGEDREAMCLYEHMQKEGVIPNEITYVYILTACTNTAALIAGIHVHAQIVGLGLSLNIIIATSLVCMYGKCGRTVEARRLFDCINKEDAIIWNAMISVYTQNGQGNDAIEIFQRMRREGVKPGKATLVTILEACASQGVLSDGKQLHFLIKEYGFESDVMVGTSLLNMYGKCGSLEEACVLFDKLIDRNVVSWNVLISSYAHRGFGLEALQCFEQMLCEAVIPDRVTFLNVISVCASNATLVECKHMHSNVVNNKLDSDANLGVGIVNMYGKSGRLEDARKVFNSLPNFNASSWTALIAAYDQLGQYTDALNCFHQMLMEGVLFDKVAAVSLISVFANQGFLGGGVRMHTHIVGSELESEIDVQNALATMYGKWSKLEDAHVVFCRMIARDAISFKVMMGIFLQLDQGIEVIQLFWQMLLEGIMPDSVTFVSILTSCGSCGAVTQGSRIHACCLHVDNSFGENDTVRMALLSMYASCGCLDSAWRIFKTIKENDVSTWNAMLEACAFHGEGKATLSLFEQMQQEMPITNRVTIIKLLAACSHAGMLSEACYVFCSIVQGFLTEVTVDHFNCMVDILGRIAQVEEAEELITRMPIPPNAMTWSILLNACRLFNDVNRGESSALFISELETDNAATYISLSNIYAAAAACDLSRIVQEYKSPCIQIDLVYR